MTSLGLVACGERAAPPEPTARVALSVGALSLPGVTDVTYTITVENGATPPEVVWSRSVSSSRYGDGRGAVSYVGPCDASEPAHTVRLTITEILGSDGTPLTDWVDPGEVSQPVTCAENADTPVVFDITVARRANQGFFDVAVQFEDVFCSAKLDCLPELLFNGMDRDTTLVVAFACTTGANTSTVLHLDTLALTCTDGTTYLDPARGPGNTSQTSAHVYEVATYRGKEALAPYEKAYWNVAVGLDLASFGAPSTVDCTLSTRATASETDWADGTPPDGAVWPYIEWSVPVVTDGQMTCTQHALNEPGSGVVTAYARPTSPGAPFSAPRFGASMPVETCDDGLCDVVRKGTVCSGAAAGVNGPVVFADTAAGVVVTMNGVASDPMPLPAGTTLTGCCSNPCCGP